MEFLAALLTPIVISLVKRDCWSSSQKRTLAAAISVLAAIAVILIDPTRRAEGFAETLLLVGTGAQAIYLGFMEDSALEGALRRAP